MTLASARAMVPQDITRIVWVSDPQISPDGARVAFVATTLSEERDAYLSNIWLRRCGRGRRAAAIHGGAEAGSGSAVVA